MYDFFEQGAQRHIGVWGEAEAEHTGVVQTCERGQAAGERLIMAEWFGLIGCESVHWGRPLREQNDDRFGDGPDDPSPCGRNPSSHNTITQMLLMLCTSVIPHFHHSLCQPFTISPSLSPLFVLPLTPAATELLMGCWACEISPAADLFAGPGVCCLL